MDSKDGLIIEELKKDSRQSVREIAKRTGLRPSTVHSRIRRLSGKLIERFTVKLNYKEMGDELVVFILVSTSAKIPQGFFNSDRIVEVHGITGEFDLIMKCRFSNVEEFNRFIIDMRNLPQVSKTLTMVGTITLKDSL